MSCFVSKLCSFLQLPFTSTWRKFSTEKSFLTLTAIHRCEFSLAVKVFSVKNTSRRVFHFWITNLKRMGIKLCDISRLMKLISPSTVLRNLIILVYYLLVHGPAGWRGSGLKVKGTLILESSGLGLSPGLEPLCYLLGQDASLSQWLCPPRCI